VPAYTGGQSPIALQGPTIWSINGKQYHVSATYYLALPEGLQYTIDYELPPSVPLPHEREAALAIALPLMQYAVHSGLYKRTAVTKRGSGAVAPSRVGITLFRQEGIRLRRYGVALSVDEITLREANHHKANSR
jgi:hypothetical protein